MESPPLYFYLAIVAIVFTLHTLISTVKAVGKDLSYEFAQLHAAIERSTYEITSAIEDNAKTISTEIEHQHLYKDM